LLVIAEKQNAKQKNNFFAKNAAKKCRNEKPEIKKRNFETGFFDLAGGRGGKNHTEIEKCKPTRNLSVDFASFSA